MGFTPLAGLPMGTRSGDLDPSIPLKLIQGNFYIDSSPMYTFFIYLVLQSKSNHTIPCLVRQKLFNFFKQFTPRPPPLNQQPVTEEGMTVSQVEDLLQNKSGLFGIAGVSDSLTVENAYKRGDPRAVLAMNMVAYSAKKFLGKSICRTVNIYPFSLYLLSCDGPILHHITGNLWTFKPNHGFSLGSYTEILEGKVDCVIFTGGVGENSGLLRKLACREDTLTTLPRLSVGGVRDISRDHNQSPRILVVNTDEERAIAEESLLCIGKVTAGETGASARC